MNHMREKWAEEIAACTTKNWPENEHHDHYSTELGWEFLGKDDKYDYYINHDWEYISIVYGSQDWEYASPDYGSVTGMFEKSELASPHKHNIAWRDKLKTLIKGER